MTAETQQHSNEFELYKLAVEMADRVSSRRATANSFFLTVQTTFIAVLGVSFFELNAAPWWISLLVTTAGFALSASWWLQLRSYRDLNRAKFAVINSIEKSLPISIFVDEWQQLKQDPVSRWRKRYAEFGTVERVVPIVFASLYAIYFIGQILT